MQKNEYYSGLRLNFGDTLHKWAAQSSAQLRDAYKLQKLWTGSKSDAVWSGRKRKFYYKGNPNQERGARKKVKVTSWSWYDEVALRIMKDKYSSKKNYWYSTGLSYQISQHNPVTVVNPSIENGIVDFHSTMGMLYSEAGVGLTGQKHTRGARGSKGRTRIKVNRSKNYKHNQKYVGEWMPMAGDTHRPSIRQQVNLFARRMRWAAQKVYHHDLTTYIGYMLEKDFSFLQGLRIWATKEDGTAVGMTLNYDETRGMLTITNKMTFEEYMNAKGDK